MVRPDYHYLSRALLGCLAVVFLAACTKNSTSTNSQANVAGPAKVDYSQRIGVAVRTNSQTCLALKNAGVSASTPITLVVPASPQRFLEGTISGQSAQACPITKDVDPAVTNYKLTVPDTADLPKLMPLIGVVGSAASGSFLIENISVQADIDQTHAKDTFRACGANDGVHLSVWNGNPVTGTRLWTGYYYEGGNPGTLPTCSATELPPPPAANPTR